MKNISKFKSLKDINRSEKCLLMIKTVSICCSNNFAFKSDLISQCEPYYAMLYFVQYFTLLYVQHFMMNTLLYAEYFTLCSSALFTCYSSVQKYTLFMR